MLGVGENHRVGEKIQHGALHPAAQRLRLKLSGELDKDYRHVEACLGLLREVTSIDPRWEMVLWDEGEKDTIRDRLIAYTVKYHQDRAAAEPSDASPPCGQVPTDICQER